MEIGKSIYNILAANTNVSNLVGTRIFPNVAPQTTAFPFIIYDVTGVQPNDTKDGVSTLDTNDIMISCYSETYSEASDLAQKIRIAMDRIPEGTYGTEQIQSSPRQSRTVRRAGLAPNFACVQLYCDVHPSPAAEVAPATPQRTVDG